MNKKSCERRASTILCLAPVFDCFVLDLLICSLLDPVLSLFNSFIISPAFSKRKKEKKEKKEKKKEAHCSGKTLLSLCCEQHVFVRCSANEHASMLDSINSVQLRL